MSCIVASLVQVMLDPYFRTIPGFQSLIQKEWVMSGYQFLDRCNHLKRSEKEVTQLMLTPVCGGGEMFPWDGRGFLILFLIHFY